MRWSRKLRSVIAPAAIVAVVWGCGSGARPGVATERPSPATAPAGAATPAPTASPAPAPVPGSLTTYSASLMTGCLSATLLKDGRVLTIGSALDESGTAYVWQSELFDPVTGLLAETGEASSGSCQHVATLLLGGLLDGRVLVTGNDGGTFLYDPATLSFSRTGSMNTARETYSQTALPGGRVLVAGGSGRSNENVVGLASAEVYDPVSQSYVLTGSMASPHGGGAAVLLKDGSVLVTDGTSAEIYDPALGKFVRTVAMTTDRVCPVAASLSDGRVLVAGGYEPYHVGGPSVMQPVSSAEVYDPVTGRFAQTGSASVPAPWVTVDPSGWASGSPVELLTLRDGRILAVVSIYGLDVLSDSGYLIEIYDPAAGRFTPVASLPSTYHPENSLTCARMNTAVVLADGSVFFPGDPSLFYWP
jgi:hypothetical protein